MVATWDDVSRIAGGLPEVDEQVDRAGRLKWRVRGKNVVWERPLRERDLAELGADAPDGPILGARTDGETEKHALIQNDPSVYFTTSHFNGYPAVLARLDLITATQLNELIVGAFLVQAPKALARAYRSRG